MRFRFAGLILFAFFLGEQVMAQTLEPQFVVVPELQYCTGGGRSLLMDVFIPKHRSRMPTPAVLWIHGGGWEHGDKNDHSGAALLANAGFVAATLNYRLSGDSPFPAAIEDCKCGIRFLRANAAKYGIDPDRIGVAGSSAGGASCRIGRNDGSACRTRGRRRLAKHIQQSAGSSFVLRSIGSHHAVPRGHCPSHCEFFSRHREGKAGVVSEGQPHRLRIKRRSTDVACPR
jgi:hypothetical protein